MLRLHLAISLGVFLFILFFQPFSLEHLDFNNRLLFFAGLASIILIFLFTIQLIHFAQVKRKREKDINSPSLIAELSFMALSSVAITFYLRYVGSYEISFYAVFKVLAICLMSLVSIRISHSFRLLRSENDSLKNDLKLFENQFDQIKEDNLNASIEFISENSNEKLNLRIADIICLQSADNYVSVIFLDGDSFRKVLIRNTLKNLELQIKPYRTFIRCHRTSIVNISYIEKLARSYGNHWLELKIYPDKIPVSRQYLAMLKEVMS